MKQKRYKYPRIPHLPWSPGAGDDDIRLANPVFVEGQEIVVTEKLDGENTTMYSDLMHARSVDSRHHLSRDWAKALHARIAYLIPKGWRICGENLYARHAIAYKNLSSYFYMFSIWNENNHCLNWDDTLEWGELLDLEVPEIFYRGPWDEQRIRSFKIDLQTQEGYVVRTAKGFDFEEFSDHVAKWVRKGHVQTDQHWMHAEIIPNRLAGSL